MILTLTPRLHSLVAHGFADPDQGVQTLGNSRLALAFSKLWAQLALGGGARSVHGIIVKYCKLAPLDSHGVYVWIA